MLTPGFPLMNQLITKNFISVDLEDWYNTTYLKTYYKPGEHIRTDLKKSLKLILNLFENQEIRGTFFVLGSIARKFPEIIKDIKKSGHEIASHGYSHTPLWDMNPDSFRNEIRKTDMILDKLTGKKPCGFRAPCASLDKSTAWAIDVLEEEGYKYDSSIFPMKTPLYGAPGAPKNIYRISSDNIYENSNKGVIIEVPFTVAELGPLNIPCTGGIYGRFLPVFLLKFFLRQTEKKRPVNFYFHPWETMSAPPVFNISFVNRFISYYNSSRYLNKIKEIIKSFDFGPFEDYIDYY